jgi:biotin operon repressor
VTVGPVPISIELPVCSNVIQDALIEELRLRWQQLGFNAANFPTIEGASCEETASQIEDAIETQLTPVVRQAPAVEPGYLGLSVDGIEVHRHSYQPVLVESRLSLAIIQRLLESGNRPISFENLADEWECMGGDDLFPSRNAVTALICRVGNRLRPLGIQIRAVRNLGWRLTEIENTNG